MTGSNLSINDLIGISANYLTKERIRLLVFTSVKGIVPPFTESNTTDENQYFMEISISGYPASHSICITESNLKALSTDGFFDFGANRIQLIGL